MFKYRAGAPVIATSNIDIDTLRAIVSLSPRATWHFVATTGVALMKLLNVPRLKRETACDIEMARTMMGSVTRAIAHDCILVDAGLSPAYITNVNCIERMLNLLMRTAETSGTSPIDFGNEAITSLSVDDFYHRINKRFRHDGFIDPLDVKPSHWRSPYSVYVFAIPIDHIRPRYRRMATRVATREFATETGFTTYAHVHDENVTNTMDERYHRAVYIATPSALRLVGVQPAWDEHGVYHPRTTEAIVAHGMDAVRALSWAVTCCV